MKRVLSQILTVMIICISLAVVPAFAVAEDDILCEQTVYDIKITVESEKNGSMTCQMTNAENTRLYGVFTVHTPDAENGKFIYTFNFRMPKTAPTGEYVVRVGNNVGSIVRKTFRYTSLTDKIAFYNNLDTQASGTIKTYFENNTDILPVDVSEYYGLSEGVMLLVDDKIYDLDLATGVNIETDTDNEIADKVEAKETLFKASFAEFMSVAQLADVSEEEWADVSQNAMDNDVFDGYFYETETAGESIIDVLTIFTKYKAETQNIAELDEAEYKKAFDRATLLYIESFYDYEMLKKAFLYYQTKGVIVSDMTNIQALVDSGNDADFWKELKLAENANCETLVTNAESIAERLAGNTENGGNGPVEIPSVSKPTGSMGLGGGGGAGGSVDKDQTDKENTDISPKPQTFSDIQNVTWAKEAIEALADMGVISGKEKGVFAPHDSVTREEFVKIIIGAFKLMDENAEVDFGDVANNRWSYKYIASAYQLGIITGTGENFSPDGKMSREDMAVVIYRTFKLSGVETNGENVSFADEKTISNYAKEAVGKLSGMGIINGMGDGTFAPKENVTRAQAAKVVYGLLNITGGKK